MSNETKTVRSQTGRVVSDKMNKTITVLIERRVKDPLYGKYLTRSRKIKAHDEHNHAKMGDMVRIEETRPIAKTVAWKLVEIINKSGESVADI